MISPEQTARLIRCFPRLGTDSGLIRQITATSSAIDLGAGHNICHQGDSCSHLALVTKGTARVFKIAESGREITLYRIDPGECCILTASCMLSGRPFPAAATVESDLEAVLIPQPKVTGWMTGSETWRHYLWGLLAERLGDVISLVEEIAFRRMDERLGEHLILLAQQHGSIIPATHQQIAADLGTSREVVSRLLKDFEIRGLLRLGRGRIELDDPTAINATDPLCD